MYLNILVLVAAIILAWHFITIMMVGRRARRTVGAEYADALAYHKKLVGRVMWLMLAAVLVIEIIVRMHGVPRTYGMLEYFHWTVDALFTLAFITTIFFRNGEKARQWHSAYAYVTIALFFLASGSGLLMLFRHPF